MESLFNIAWALLGVVGLTVGLVYRLHIAPVDRKELVRDVILLCGIIFLLLPVISLSDDIGYFNYYFSRGQAPDSVMWVNGLRRNKQLPGLIILQSFAFLLAAALGMFCRRTVSGTIESTEPVRIASRNTTPANLRAPPLLF